MGLLGRLKEDFEEFGIMYVRREAREGTERRQKISRGRERGPMKAYVVGAAFAPEERRKGATVQLTATRTVDTDAHRGGEGAGGDEGGGLGGGRERRGGGEGQWCVWMGGVYSLSCMAGVV